MPIVLGGYFLFKRAAGNLFLLLASILFYAWGEPSAVVVMLVSTAINGLLGIWVSRLGATAAGRSVATAAVIFNLSILIYYKYTVFLWSSLGSGLVSMGVVKEWPVLEAIHLPAGISFYTFHAMSYVLDVYRRRAEPQRSPIRFALYIALFPQLVAGPIVRYHEIADQLSARKITLDSFAEGVRRFIVGLGKKMLIANTMAMVADPIFNTVAIEKLTLPVAWLGAAAYALQIYFDFSGYSDMAIGLGRMFGFRLPENFNYPYVSHSITEFWQRWHITLSSWLRDYLFFPLSRRLSSGGGPYLASVLVMSLCGLWHGANWTFLAWGFTHGMFMVVERLAFKKWLDACPSLIRNVYVSFVLLTTWVLFRSDSIGDAVGRLGVMFGAGSASREVYHIGLYVNSKVYIAFAAGIIGCTPVIPLLIRRWERFGQSVEPQGRWSVVAKSIVEFATVGFLCLILLACATQLAAQTYNPFIYFRF